MWDLIVSVPDHCLSFYFPIGWNFSNFVDCVLKLFPVCACRMCLYLKIILICTNLRPDNGYVKTKQTHFQFRPETLHVKETESTYLKTVTVNFRSFRSRTHTSRVWLIGWCEVEETNQVPFRQRENWSAFRRLGFQMCHFNFIVNFSG